MRRYSLAVLAYLVPTFALGFVWHLVLFQSYYDALGVYRRMRTWLKHVVVDSAKVRDMSA